MSEEDTSHRPQELSGPPDGYVRRETIFKTIGAAVGILGAMLGLVRFFDAYREYVDSKIREERNERINQDNKIENRLDGCCGRRR